MKSPLLSFLAFFAAISCAAAAADPLRPAWEEAATFLAADAHDAFVKAAAAPAGPGRREAELGAAVSLLDLQPRTERKVEEARESFRKLAETDPGDEVGLEARYFLARIVQVHQPVPDPARAEQMYRALFHDSPGSDVGQAALEKAAILCLYATAAPAERPARFAELEQLGAGLSDPAAAGNFHFLLGQAAFQLGLPPEKAYEHLKRADEIGIVGEDARSLNLIRLGQLALRLGKKEAAAGYWTAFVQRFPRDPRNYLIRQKLAQLGAPLS